MKNILVLLGLKKETPIEKAQNKLKKGFKRFMKYSKKHKLFHKVFAVTMGLLFLATAVLPYIV